MSLAVRPDPRHPEGGFACLDLPAGSLEAGRVTVAVFDVFGARWLAPSEPAGAPVGIGNPNWQSESHGFGPYEVRSEAGTDRVRIGPEIVNKIDAYMPLRISVGGETRDVTWPDDVPPRAGAAGSGGLRVAPRPAAPPPELPPAPAPPATGPRPAPASGETAEADPAAVRPPGSLILPLGLLLLAVLAALSLWLFFVREPRSGAEGARDAQDACSLDALAALPGGYPEIEQAIRDCGASLSADTALRLVEDAAARNDPQALLLFGTIYDGEQLDPRIENLIGLSFEDDPARAAEYYDRAAAAGSAEARTRLAAICDRLPGSTATLDKGAYDDFCR